MTTVNAKVVGVYKDIDLNFTKTTGGDILVLNQEDAIKQSVRNNILTNFNERRFLPHFGCDITRNMFELADGVLGLEIETAIAESIANYEPRVNIINTRVTVDNHTIQVQLEFRMTNIPKVLSLDINIERIR